MNKQDIVKAIAKDTELTQVAVNKMINSLERLVSDCLARGEKAQLTGFVTFKPIYRAARKGFDPINKVPMDIAPAMGVSVKAGDKIREAIKALDITKFAPAPGTEPEVEDDVEADIVTPAQ